MDAVMANTRPCSACLIGGNRRVPATHASRYGGHYAYCDAHAGPDDPLLAVAAPAPAPIAPPEPRPDPPKAPVFQRPGVGRYERTFEDQVKHGAGKLHISVDEYRAHIEAGERWCTSCKQWHPADQMVRLFGAPNGMGKICRAAARERYRQQVARKAAGTEQ